MKKGYKISLFLVLLVFGVVAGILWFRLTINRENTDLEFNDFKINNGEIEYYEEIQSSEEVLEVNHALIPDGFYIMAVDGDIHVYRGDRVTLYFKTGLALNKLPINVQEEVINGKYLESEIAVYHFIESYSS